MKIHITTIICFVVFTCSTGLAQPVFKEQKIKLTRSETRFPVYYFKNGYTTVFDATELLAHDTLHPLLNRYDMLTGFQDSVWVYDLADLSVYDSTHVWEHLIMAERMNELISTGRVEVWGADSKSVRVIIKYREEDIPIVGTNYYYAESKKSARIFEYFKVFWGCPAF
ncbi:MAG: hypothetical protein HYZ14_15950 [Bacteroidetes bacterium]|nr:hypothetical protein [Bacteroidota bacterium]